MLMFHSFPIENGDFYHSLINPNFNGGNGGNQICPKSITPPDRAGCRRQAAWTWDPLLGIGGDLGNVAMKFINWI